MLDRGPVKQGMDGRVVREFRHDKSRRIILNVDEPTRAQHGVNVLKHLFRAGEPGVRKTIMHLHVPHGLGGTDRGKFLDRGFDEMDALVLLTDPGRRHQRVEVGINPNNGLANSGLPAQGER